MKLIVIDSNIFFSSLRSRQSKLLDFLETSRDMVFYTPNFLIVEIFKHRERLRKKSKLTEEEFLELMNAIVQRLRFFNEDMISTASLIHAWRLVHDIDPKDHLFVALTLELEAELWTRDEILRSGLMKKGFTSFFDENEPLTK